MTFLALDFGNTAVKAGLFEDSTLLCDSRWHYDQRESFFTWLSNQSFLVKRVGVSSVTPQQTQPWLTEIKARLKLEEDALWAVDPTSTPLPISVPEYPLKQIGVDRLVSACGLVDYYPDAVRLIYDFGTATTIDVLGPGNVFLGGAICPGMEPFWSLLDRSTEQLPSVPMSPYLTGIGKSTEACLQIGLSTGYVGLIEAVTQQIKSWVEVKYPQETVYSVYTGGMANAFIRLSQTQASSIDYQTGLTLRGLHRLSIQ